MQTGQYVKPSRGRMTAAELAPEWLERKKQVTAPSHHRMLESAWRIHVHPRWGEVSVADIDVCGIEAWISAMIRHGAGATTVLRAYGVLSGILGAAVKGKRLAGNPAKDVDNLPRKTARRHVYLSADDVRRLADESGQHRVLVLTLAYTGIRWGEAIALRVRDVEFLRRRLAVSENAVQLGVDHAVGPTKGRKARSVPVPEFVLNELSRQCAGRGLDELVFVDGASYLPLSCADTYAARAVAEGFEPSDGRYPSHAFEACSLGRSDTPPPDSLPNAALLTPIAGGRRRPPAGRRIRRPAPRPAPPDGG
jgi:integrase